jgi:hypothetical protein
MSLALLMSLALVSGDASTFKIAQAEPPVSTGQSRDDEIRAAAAAAGDPFPTGAPVDDYGFVGWCYGALSTHMSLRPKVWSEVERIEREFPDPNASPDSALAGYDQQMKEGQTELALFDKALKSKKGDRAAAVASGEKIWAGSDNTSTRQLAQLWMSWALPGRCQTTANKLLAE